MKRKSSNSAVLVCTLIVMISPGHYVHGVGYQLSNRHSREAEHNDNGNSAPANYNFEYGVVDDGGTGPQFGHEEERNGYQTRGRYSVVLPDGRLQVVSYKADKNGYVADITYENGPAQNKNEGYNMGGYGGYETSATSYGPPPLPPPQPSSSSSPSTQHNDNHNNKGGGYNGKDFGSGGTNSAFGRRNSRSFVKLRRTINGKMFNFMY